jgi:hypothetical protein
MTTLNEMIAIIKAENPTLQVGDDEQGYTPITSADYEAQILEWAEARFAKQTAKEKAEAAKASAEAKLAALGLLPEDLIALGLKVEESTNLNTTLGGN